MSAENYEVLKILTKQNPFKTYKVKHKYTSELYVWSIIDYEQFKMADLDDLEERLKLRMGFHHPNILEFREYFKQEEDYLLYIVSKFCKNGSLHDLLKICIDDHKHFTEEFLCKIVYQIALCIKTTDHYDINIELNKIFIDEDFNVKLHNFSVNNDPEKQLETLSIGILLYKLCCLRYSMEDIENIICNKSSIWNENLKYTYSKEMISFMYSLLQNDEGLKENIDKILCNPTLLLKSQQWNKSQCFVKIDRNIKLCTMASCQEARNSLQIKLEELKNKEAALLIREQKLNEREQKLANKEKKIILIEKKVQEKLQKVEMYFKQTSDIKSSASGSSYSVDKENSTKYPLTQVNLDSTYVSCIDSVAQPTSRKLNVNAIIKPAPFTRTLSERRIRFKGYSPLKDVDSNKRRSIKVSKQNMNRNLETASKSDWVTCSDDNVSVDLKKNSLNKKCKQLFPKSGAGYENACDIKLNNQCMPQKWTEENKKYAFKLLKLMNSNKENLSVEVKHTYL